MKKKPISQRVARAAMREVKALKDRIVALESRYCADFPGTHIASIQFNEITSARMQTANRLGFSLVIRHESGDTYGIRALRVSGE